MSKAEAVGLESMSLSGTGICDAEDNFDHADLTGIHRRTQNALPRRAAFKPPATGEPMPGAKHSPAPVEEGGRLRLPDGRYPVAAQRGNDVGVVAPQFIPLPRNDCSFALPHPLLLRPRLESHAPWCASRRFVTFVSCRSDGGPNFFWK